MFKALQVQPWLSSAVLGKYIKMDKTGGSCPQGLFKLVEGARNNGEYEINQIQWPQSLSSKIDYHFTVSFLALQFCESSGKVLKKEVGM